MRGQHQIIEQEGTIIEKNPIQEMCELSDEDIGFLNENGTLNQIAPLFLLEKKDRKLTDLFGKLIYADFVFKYLHTYSEMVKKEFDFDETTPKEICDKDFIERMSNKFDENKNKYILTTKDKVIPQISEFFDLLKISTFEDLVLLSNLCETQYEMIKEMKDGDILWLTETINQFKRMLDNLNFLRERRKESIEIGIYYKKITKEEGITKEDNHTKYYWEERNGL